MPAAAAVLEAAPTDALHEAHAELRRLHEQAGTLMQERQAAARVVDRRKAERASAQAVADAAKAKALAAKADARPAYLIDAERKLSESTAELDFAESALTKAAEALSSNGAAINAATTEVRAVARSMLPSVASEMAAKLTRIESEAAKLRVEFRGLVTATQGLGVNLPPNAVDCYRMPPGFDGTEPTLNSPGWRRERELANEWRQWVDAAVKNPNAEMPT
jgi:hypothetical protein